MKKDYGIEWLRALACIGIAAMHMRANNKYALSGFLYDNVVISFTDLVYLFMAVSAFGMCCGYYDRVMTGKVDWPQFYKKRYAKILPFFALLIIIDLVHSFSINSLLEGFTELTLMHGFVPNDLKVIGVGWFLGTVFVFYLIFPFFCSIISNKFLAWMTMIVAIMLNLICIYYYGLDRHNILVSSSFFMVGGLLFIYREKVEKTKWYYILIMLLISLVAYYYNANIITRVLTTASILALAINAPLPEIKAVSFISGISMEIYLSHMFIFRIFEKIHLNYLFGNGLLQYCFIIVIVLAGASVFSYFAQLAINKLLKTVSSK